MNDNNNEQITSLTRDLELIRERYLKLVDIHGEVQKQNSLLEERILSIVETYSNEKEQLEQDLMIAKQRIRHLEDTVNDLEIEKQRYKDDCNLAVRLLHQHPNEFISTTTTSEHLPEQMKYKNESHNVIIPTFPPIFATSFPLYNTTTTSSSSSPIISQTTTIMKDNLRLAESLFKSNTVHRYPSTHFICSNCHRTMKCCDVSVQTSLDDQGVTSRARIVSLTTSDDGLNGDTAWVSVEPHNHAHMTVQEYQMGNTRRPFQDIGLPSNSIPQMHHV